LTTGQIEDSRRQLAVALGATSLLVAIMWYAPGAGGEGLTPELMFAALPLVIGIAWIYPVEVALVFIAATMFRVHEAYPILVPYRIPLVTASLALLAVSMHLAARNMSLPWRPELKLALLLAAHVTFGMLFGVNRPNSFENWPDALGKQVAGMVFLAMILRLPRDAMRVAMVLVFASMLISFVAIYNQLNGIDLVEGNRVSIGREMKSVLGDPNDLCFALMFPVAFAVAAVLTRGVSTGVRTLCLIALSAMLWAIIATKSRGGVMATVVVFGFLFAVLRNARMSSMALAAIGGVLLYIVAGIGERNYGMGATDAIDASALGRVEAWKAAVRMALVYPVFGVGLNNFTQLYYFYSDFWDGRAYATHSIWFQVLADAGFVGAGLFIAMVTVSIRSAWRSMRRLLVSDAPAEVKALAASIVASWLGVCVAGSFLSQAFSWQIFTLVALTAVLSRHVTETYPEGTGGPGPATTGVHEPSTNVPATAAR
jgi:probable O-glycosylation ligase (exosortase A-associated)